MLGTRLLDRYELTEELGRGGMGVVFKAHDPLLDREVAVKMLPPGFLKPRAEERFRREARLVAQMDHPAIVPIYDFGHHDSSLFLVMPFLQGTTLRQLIRTRKLVLGEAVEAIAAAADALDYSHGQGVIHRDVKPENIMISREQGLMRVRLMDFGLAREAANTRLTQSGGILGTLSYMSPEQVSAQGVDGRADLYALGAVLYECLAGEPPFVGPVHALILRIVQEDAVPPSERGIEVATELEALAMRCLAKDPGARPASGRELATGLRQAATQLDEAAQSRILGTERRPGAGRERPRSPFVGRQEELAQLQQRLHEACRGNCQLVLVEGDAGAGKSRLLEALAGLARARGICVLSGRFADHRAAYPFQGFCELIVDYFKAGSPTSSTSEVADLSDLLPELLGLFPQLAEVAELRSASVSSSVDLEASTASAETGSAETFAAPRRPTPASAGPHAGPAGAREPVDVFELVARTLIRLGSGRPMLLLVDGLHDADVSVEGLEYLVRRLGPTPTLVVGTFRAPEAGRGHPLRQLVENFHAEPRFEKISLGPLSEAEVRELAAQEIGSAELDQPLVAKITETSEGNPLFVRELIRSLLRSDAIRRDTSGYWRLSSPEGLPGDILPATLQQAAMKRINRLPEEHRKILNVASVLGRAFEYSDLEALFKDAGSGHAELDDTVESLLDDGILEEESRLRGERLRFTSGVVRDVVYGELSRRRRRTLHRRHAERLERRHAGRLERVLPQLVHHFAAADMAVQTVGYALVQARRALAAGAAEDALRMSRLALEFVDDEHVEDATRTRGELEMVAGRAERQAGHLAAAEHHGEQAFNAFQETSPADAAAAALLLAEVAWQARQVDAARLWAKRGIEAARSADARISLRPLLTLGATLANLHGEYAAASYYLRERDRLAEAEPKRRRELPRGGILVTAAASTVLHLDPSILHGDMEVEMAANLFDTLLAAGDGVPEPRLAREYTSDDGGGSFLVTLRADVRFSDGTPLTAAAVRASLLRSARRAAELGVPLRPALEVLVEDGDGTVPGGELRGVEVRGEDQVLFHLRQPLPIFPTLLTDPATAIVHKGPNGELLGTGPFRLERGIRSGRAMLEPNPHSFHGAPRVEAIDLRTSLDPPAISRGLLDGEIDVGRDLQPEDLEELLRHRRFRSALVEATKKNLYFVLVNGRGPTTRHAALRRALTGAVNTHDLVWRNLGRFAQPAVGLIPPGLLGHDPGRRRHHLSRDEAQAMIAGAGLETPIQLHAAIHPLIVLRYGELVGALLAAWEELGFFVKFEHLPMSDFRDAYRNNDAFDLLIGRWIADYDDPDDFTYGFFHSVQGRFRNYFSSPDADRLLELARRETVVGARAGFYRELENLLEENGALLPLFHGVHHRIAGSRVRGLTVGPNPPYVNYATLGKLTETDPTEPVPLMAGELAVALPGRVHSLDPASSHLAEYVEVVPMVFETLTRVEEGALVVPWLAAGWDVFEGGRRYSFRLREKVRFHDGRRLTARDVRYSFERLLRSPRSEVHFLLLRIRGARAWRDGEASSLAGFFIRSPHEIEIELEETLSFFPALLSHPATAIVPEGSEGFQGSWRDGCVGTGPFRVLRFEPRERLDLERHLEYWRPGFPKSDNLVFRFGVSAAVAVDELRHGRLAVVTELEPSDVETLRRDPKLAGAYFESPRLATYFLVLNARSGPFADAGLRRAFADALDIDAAVGTAGRLVIRAHGLIPPGLLGHEGAPPSRTEEIRPATLGAQSAEGAEVRAFHHPIFAGQYAVFWDALVDQIERTGLAVPSEMRPVAEILQFVKADQAHLLGFRWVADYPDTDGFVANLLHSEEGALAQAVAHPEIDRLIEQGRRESDPGMRHAVYRDLEALIAREALIIPLFHEQIYRFCHPSVRGFRFGISAPEVRYEELFKKR